MRIDKIEPIDKIRVMIHVEGESDFWLYKKDIRTYGLKENGYLSDSQYEQIYLECVLIYAKKSALAILERMDRSEAQLRQKLKEKKFSEEVIQEAILYVKKFHYIDDYRFASNYIHSRITTKSKRQLVMSLGQKGVAKELIEEAYNEVTRSAELNSDDNEQINPEIEAIQKFIRKKGRTISEYSKEEKMKLYGALYRKGFSAHNIQDALSCDVECMDDSL